ncbi:MAG: glycoside hydrolase family 13 protein [Bacteroidota bacterium]|nr:glycoside hydrolase family 13 protein [Bacteroidota bacterium]
MLRRSVILLFSLLTLSLYAQIERVEPTFWWVGMKNPQLQLLIHGSGICNRQVIIQYPGVQVLKTNRACSPNYLFVTLNIDPKTAKAGLFDIRLREPEKADLSFSYELKNRRSKSAQREGFTSADVMYLLMPDRFANGNPQNDNIDSLPDKVNRTLDDGRHGGDIKGIQDHLDYIKGLGATAIWCTPMLENNYEKASYHGYAISDYYKTDPRFGNNGDYVNLVEASHQKGLKVIMDMVANHCGTGAWWMSDLPFEDWIHQWPAYTQTNVKFSTLKDTHAADVDKKKFIDGWFDKTMPDMNQQNSYFWTYYIQNSIWWVEYANLDGIRMDTYPYNDRDAMATWAKAITDEYPHFNIVGETGLYNTPDNAFWQKDAFNSLQYNSQLPTVMDFTLQTSLSKCFNEHGKPWEEVGMNRIYNTVANDYWYANINNILVFVENHDTQRFNNLIKGDLDKFKLAMSYLMTTRGIPQIYYGSEIGMTGNKDKNDGDVRRDFPGGWPGDSINAFSAAGRTPVQNEYFNYLSKLLNWRKGKEVIHTGLLTHYVPENDVYVYFRYNDQEKIMVVINNNETEQTLNTDRYAESLKDKTTGTDVLTGKNYNLSSAITIPKETALILELK